MSRMTAQKSEEKKNNRINDIINFDIEKSETCASIP